VSSKMAPSKVSIDMKKNEVTSKPVSSSGKKGSPTSAKPPTSSKDMEAGKNREQDEDENEQRTLHLKGFSEDEEDDTSSSDEESNPIDVSKLPSITKDNEMIRKRLENAKKQLAEGRGVIHIGRVPHGFYEDQMRGYFSQFGEVTRLRLSRNKKTGRSKHYAFVEFDSYKVAEIVADTMDNYLLHGHMLRCKVMPKDQIHPNLWIGANRKFRKIPHDRIARLEHNKERTTDQQKKAESRLLRRQKARASKLAKLGVSYDLNATGFKRRL